MPTYFVKVVVTDESPLTKRATIPGEGGSIDWIELMSYRKASRFAVLAFNLLNHLEGSRDRLIPPKQFPLNPLELVSGLLRFSNQTDTIIVLIAQNTKGEK